MGATRLRSVGATTRLLLVCLLASSLAGCGRDQTPIPAGAQQVHVQVVG